MFRWLMIIAVFYFVWWWIAFFVNPYHFCKDHPDKELKEVYYLCEPFGFDYPTVSFDLEKGKFETTNRIGVFVTPMEQQYKDPNIYETNKRIKCSDPLFRRTQQGKEVCK